MEREFLERVAFDVIMGGMDHNGEEDEVWAEIKGASDEDLIGFIVAE